MLIAEEATANPARTENQRNHAHDKTANLSATTRQRGTDGQ